MGNQNSNNKINKTTALHVANMKSALKCTKDSATEEENHINEIIHKFLDDIHYYEQANVIIDDQVIVLIKYMCYFLVVNDWYVNSIPEYKSHLILYLEILHKKWSGLGLDVYIAYFCENGYNQNLKSQINVTKLNRTINSKYFFML